MRRQRWTRTAIALAIGAALLVAAAGAWSDVFDRLGTSTAKAHAGPASPLVARSPHSAPRLSGAGDVANGSGPGTHWTPPASSSDPSGPPSPLPSATSSPDAVAGTGGSVTGTPPAPPAPPAATPAPPRASGPTPTPTSCPPVGRDVQYGSAGGAPLLLDVYLPSGGAPHPAVVVVHGGAWVSGDKSLWAAEGQRLAGEGFAAFVANYRLAPPGGNWPSPAALDDLRAAVAWIRANAACYGVDPGRVGALGGSAGGNLAMLLGTGTPSGGPAVSAVVAWSGPTDLVELSGGGIIPSYIGCGYSTCPDRWQAASPIYWVSAGDAPTFLANSTDELIPASQAQRMAGALRGAGVPSQLVLVEGSAHSRSLEGAVWGGSIAFLQTHLGR